MSHMENEWTINVPEDQRKLKVGMISDWTLTAIELWRDKKFLEKRYQEQIDYLKELEKRELSLKTFNELKQSAVDVAMKVINRLHELEREEE